MKQVDFRVQFNGSRGLKVAGLQANDKFELLLNRILFHFNT